MHAVLTLLCCAAMAAPSAEVQVPANDGWVTDLADLLTTGQEQQLELLMESYRQGSTHEITLLTLPELDGEAIENVALEVARDWGVGGAETSNGALLVVAQAERKLRIEVGRGLEGALPDVICGRIIRDVITPAFRRGDVAGGIHLGIVAMHSAIGGDYGPIRRSSRGRQRGGGLGGLLVIGFVIFMLVSGRRRGGGGGGGSIWPWIFMSSMMSGRGGLGGGGGGFSGGGGGFGGFGGGGGFSGGGASGGW
ncbi:MAG: hypothetical protein ACI8QZ_003945 [Chlamydiales bacterium]|jgi:uncharacterized protein